MPLLTVNPCVCRRVKKHTSKAAFLNWCKKRGYKVNKENNDFKRLSDDSIQIALTPDEVNKMRDVRLASGHELSAARDLFLLQCFIGLLYSDFVKLMPVNVKGVANRQENRQIKITLDAAGT